MSDGQRTRRVVTGTDIHGRSAVLSDGQPPRSHGSAIQGGLNCALAWATDRQTTYHYRGVDPTPQITSYVPGPGATRLLIAEFPPLDAEKANAVDPEIAAIDLQECLPGLAELIEPNGMHSTKTVDYSIVLSGELWLELEDGSKTRLEAGDIVIQNGVRHAWHNTSSQPAVLAAVLIGV